MVHRHLIANLFANNSTGSVPNFAQQRTSVGQVWFCPAECSRVSRRSLSHGHPITAIWQRHLAIRYLKHRLRNSLRSVN